MKRTYLLAAAALVAALSTASLLAGLRHALGRRERRPAAATGASERERVRAALAGMLAPPIDFNNWPEHLRPTADMPDRDTVFRSMPRLDPPLSQTIRDELDESRY